MPPSAQPDVANPVLAEYLKNTQQTAKPREAEQTPPVQGSLATNSIFDIADPDRARRAKVTQGGARKERDAQVMAAKLDPQPELRRRWERKMVIKAVQKRGRLSRTQVIKRTEREFEMASQLWKTSVKKLGPLARQIAGKPIEEAIVQMQYSKKKAAVEIHNHLIEARDRAIVERGMGLGVATGETGGRKMFRLKDGTLHHVYDKTGIYVEQAWVNKGSYGMDSSPRARGRVDRLRLPQTSKYLDIFGSSNINNTCRNRCPP